MGWKLKLKPFEVPVADKDRFLQKIDSQDHQIASSQRLTQRDERSSLYSQK